ncbi:MAG TPA: hypothetical protein VGP82_04625, partial [Ktedonobacterales bacterium]|nr:hypothetical protein [Ktedonobacterales bacterium]
LILAVQVILLRDPALPAPRFMRYRPLTAALVVTGIFVVVVTLYRLLGLIDPTLLGRVLSSLLAALRLSILDSKRAAFSLIDAAFMVIFWLDALARRLRGRGTDATTTLERAVDRLPGENFAGDLVAAAVLALVLAPLFTRGVMGFILSDATLTQCDLSWFTGTCTGGGAAVRDPPTLIFINLVVLPLGYLGLGLLILLISAILRALRSSEEEVGISILAALRAAVERRLVPLTLLRSLRVFWPLLLLVAVISAAAAATFIELFLHGVVLLQAAEPAPSVFVLDLNPTNYLWEFAALACGTLVLLATVVAMSLYMFPHRGGGHTLWRGAAFSRRRLRRVGLIAAQTYWIFAVILTILNGLLLATRAVTRAPFTEPEPLTAISFAIFLAVTVTWLQTRRGHAQARALAASDAMVTIPTSRVAEVVPEEEANSASVPPESLDPLQEAPE